MNYTKQLLTEFVQNKEKGAQYIDKSIANQILEEILLTSRENFDIQAGLEHTEKDLRSALRVANGSTQNVCNQLDLVKLQLGTANNRIADLEKELTITKSHNVKDDAFLGNVITLLNNEVSDLKSEIVGLKRSCTTERKDHHETKAALVLLGGLSGVAKRAALSEELEKSQTNLNYWCNAHENVVLQLQNARQAESEALSERDHLTLELSELQELANGRKVRNDKLIKSLSLRTTERDNLRSEVKRLTELTAVGHTYTIGDYHVHGSEAAINHVSKIMVNTEEQHRSLISEIDTLRAFRSMNNCSTFVEGVQVHGTNAAILKVEGLVHKATMLATLEKQVRDRELEKFTGLSHTYVTCDTEEGLKNIQVFGRASDLGSLNKTISNLCKTIEGLEKAATKPPMIPNCRSVAVPNVVDCVSRFDIVNQPTAKDGQTILNALMNRTTKVELSSGACASIKLYMGDREHLFHQVRKFKHAIVTTVKNYEV